MTDDECHRLFEMQAEPRQRGKKTTKAPLLRAEKKSISSTSTSIETNTLVDVQGKAVGTDFDANVSNAGDLSNEASVEATKDYSFQQFDVIINAVGTALDTSVSNAGDPEAAEDYSFQQFGTALDTNVGNEISFIIPMEF